MRRNISDEIDLDKELQIFLLEGSNSDVQEYLISLPRVENAQNLYPNFSFTIMIVFTVIQVFIRQCDSSKFHYCPALILITIPDLAIGAYESQQVFLLRFVHHSTNITITLYLIHVSPTTELVQQFKYHCHYHLITLLLILMIKNVSQMIYIIPGRFVIIIAMDMG